MKVSTNRKSIIYKTLPILLLCLGLEGSLQAQMQMSVDTTHIRIGEQITLSLRGATVYPTLDDLSQDNLQAVEQWYDTATSTQHIRLTSFEVGQHWLKVGDDSLLITVDDVANVDTSKADIKDIADIAKEPLTFYDVLRWVWIPVVIAMIVWLILWLRRRRMQQVPEEERPTVPLLPADQQALADLEILRKKQLWQQGKVKEYHTELTDIVRLYLERAHGIPSAEMTSDQTQEAYDRIPLSRTANGESYRANRERLRRVLQTADMVKFAKSEPLPYEHDRSLGDAADFVKADTLLRTPDPSADKEKEDTHA